MSALDCLASRSHLVFNFNSAATTEYFHVVTRRNALGRPISVLDAQIVSMCVTRVAVLATSNAKDFQGGAGVELVNPWD